MILFIKTWNLRASLGVEQQLLGKPPSWIHRNIHWTGVLITAGSIPLRRLVLVFQIVPIRVRYETSIFRIFRTFFDIDIF